MARKANSPQNLVPFKKGQSGNPAGRPKKLPDLENLLAEVLGEKDRGKSALLRILIALRRKALSGDVRCSELLLDRAYGKLRVSAGLEIDIMKLTDEQIDQILTRLIRKDDVKEIE